MIKDEDTLLMQGSTTGKRTLIKTSFVKVSINHEGRCLAQCGRILQLHVSP